METPPAPRLVPAPTLVSQDEGGYRLTDVGVDADAGMEETGALLTSALASTGLPSEGDTIRLVLEPREPGAYTLDIDADGVTIAGDADGVFWGTQTLRQLLPPETLGAASDVDPVLPLVHIEDHPRFAWRGYMLDVARHFFTKEEVERQIDLMALHRMSVLHVHLTDDQGWRIEIEGWPELTEIGGATEVGGGAGGWYTAADWAEIVDYGAARHITVIPEIDFPGHANAAVASVAALNESGEPAEVYTGEGVISTPLWLDGPETYGFVADVWAAMAAMTPGEDVHVGGDEAVDIEADDYATFVQFLQDTVEGEGKTLTGWDEIATADLETPYNAQYWWDEGNAQDARDAGAGVVMSPASHCYLDMVYEDWSGYGQVWAGPVSLETAYDWEPVPEGWEESDVRGVEGALWTELVEDEERVDFMTWPRLAALAEVGWREERDWGDFADRMAWHGKRLDALGVNYYRTTEVFWE